MFSKQAVEKSDLPPMILYTFSPNPEEEREPLNCTFLFCLLFTHFALEEGD